MVQLKLFEPIVLREDKLVADSKRNAFWTIRLVQEGLSFGVLKESGIGGKIMDRRQWWFDNSDEAEKVYRRRLAAKLNPDRKSVRKYRRVDDK